MTGLSLHPTPRYSVIIKEQISAIGLALRKEGILFVALLGIMAAMSGMTMWRYHRTLSDQAQNSDYGRMSHVGMGNSKTDSATVLSFSSKSDTTVRVLKRDTNVALPIGGVLGMSLIPLGLIGVLLSFGLAGIVIPFGVWRSEDPSKRSYHWAMPIPRGPHTLIKVFSGWLWLILVVAVYIGFLSALGTIAAHVIDGFRLPSLAVGWHWVVPFLASTLIYLVTSIAVVSSGHAWRWAAAVGFLYMIAISCAAALGLHDVMNVLKQVTTGNYGILTALFGAIGPESHDRTMIWLKALALWMALSIIGVCIASYRRKDNYAA